MVQSLEQVVTVTLAFPGEGVVILRQPVWQDEHEDVADWQTMQLLVQVVTQVVFAELI